MKRIIAITLLAMSTLANAATATEICSEVGLIAGVVMKARQDGSPISQQMAAAESLKGRNGSDFWYNLAALITTHAYSIQVLDTYNDRATIVKMFAERKELECHKGLLK